MDQNHFEALLKKAEDNQLTPSERLELTRELNLRLEQYNMVLEQALAANPEGN
jgi:hypothetical protein